MQTDCLRVGSGSDRSDLSDGPVGVTGASIDCSRNATAANSLGWSSRSEWNPRLTEAQSCPESRSDGTVLNTMTIQSAVALRLTPGAANQPGVPLDDSLHPRVRGKAATLGYGI